MRMTGSTFAHDCIALATETDTFERDIIEGLSRRQKSIPSRYFYDDAGSELFERITELPEYYPTRVETSILQGHAAEIADGIAEDGILVELGSGSSRKTEILLDAAPRLAAYVAIDVSPAALEDAALRIRARYPTLEVRPVQADFMQSIPLPHGLVRHRKLGFFPGSTIGNFEHDQAVTFLNDLRRAFSDGDRLVIGADLIKDEDVLLRAYDDSAGVTAAFNLNLLARINRTYGRIFDLDTFRHRAVLNRQRSRIEMHLVSTEEQVIRFRGHIFRFNRGETIHTESSHKYTLESFRRLAHRAGWHPRSTWTDDKALFSVHELVVG
jgi:dimethylhistidine N-methyltransferase